MRRLHRPREAAFAFALSSIGCSGGNEQTTPPGDAEVDTSVTDVGTDVSDVETGVAGDTFAEATTDTPPPAVVDATTLKHKLLMGYQGWFLCPGDGAPTDRWVHWFRTQTPSATTVTVDLWPDTSMLDAGERCATPFSHPDGTPAPLYSAWNEKTVRRHFQWMKDHGLDGVMLQRFTSELSDPVFFAARNKVAQNVRAAAEATGRTFAIMYDVSGQNAATMADTLKKDWDYLTTTLGLTKSPRYLQHKGKPLVAIWGFGFADRPGTPAQAAAIIADFKAKTTLMGGVPREWRTLGAWLDTLRGFDVVSPWSVGAFVDEAGADVYRKTLEGDLADCTAHGIEYMPVVFPGFSWHNLNGGPVNQIPRRGGKFYWRQIFNAVDVGVSMIYGAMFDEVDEGTAMYLVAKNVAAQPKEGTFVPLDVDGIALPNDWYLRLADHAGRALRGEVPKSAAMPIAPP